MIDFCENHLRIKRNRIKIMKARRFVTLLCLVLVLVTALTACTKDSEVKYNDSFVGRWGYIHEPEKEAFVLKDNGKAILDEKEYTYTKKDETTLLLTDKDGNVTEMAIAPDGEDEMYIYKTQKYSYMGEGTPDGLVGTWNALDSNLSFEFTAQGEFKEDGYFPGYYLPSDDNTSLKLIYNDHFEDTTIFYSIEGKELTVRYPWKMIRIK